MKQHTLRNARGGIGDLDSDLPPCADQIDFYREERKKALQWARYHIKRDNVRFALVSLKMAWYWHEKVMVVRRDQDERPTKPFIGFRPLQRVMNT